MAELQKIMATRTPPKSFYDLWFPKHTRNITIVAPPSSDGLEDAKLTSPNYAMLDRLGDRDSVYSIGKLLSRRYPAAVIHLVSSEDFARQSLAQNFVIIGGPGGVADSGASSDPNPLVGNQACRKFAERNKSRFAYSADCEVLVIGNQKFAAEFDSSGYLIKDHGVFSASSNPYLRSTRIVLLHGIHTLGVLGATRVFDGELDSHSNFSTLADAVSAKPRLLDEGFECHFPVDVMHGEVECPEISIEAIFALKASSATNATGLQSSGFLPQSSILSALDLRAEIVQLVEVALQQTLEANREILTTIQKKITEWNSPTLEMAQQILDVCRRNQRIPPEYANEILRILSNDNTKTSHPHS